VVPVQEKTFYSLDWKTVDSFCSIAGSLHWAVLEICICLFFACLYDYVTLQCLRLPARRLRCRTLLGTATAKTYTRSRIPHYTCYRPVMYCPLQQMRCLISLYLDIPILKPYLQNCATSI
jgi:hypothetical protein